jgi:ribonucleoside-diphosphate reductase alpha chain
MKVIKRDGSEAYLDTSKMHKMLEASCKGINNVKVETIEKFTHINFYDGITTDAIQNILIRNTADLINVRTPNYQYVAGRLLLFSIRKQVWNSTQPISLLEQIRANVDRGFYQSDLESLYSKDEWLKIEDFINYERDLDFNYSALKQICDKYLIKNRVTGEYYETPQVMYILIAAIIFSAYPKETRLKYVEDYYNAISTHKINISTPILAGVRSTVKQYSSCVLIKVADTLNSIFASNSVMGTYVAQRAGIGLDVGSIRASGAAVRNGEAKHTGAVGFIKMYEATLGSCSQGGLRKGSATLFYPFWHKDVESFLVLKNNRGTEENRARRLDFGVTISKLFYQRFIEDKTISLFDPNDVRELEQAFGMPEFDELYLKYEQDTTVDKTAVKAVDLFMSLVDERAETGRVYIANIDSINEHSSFDIQLSQSNLCMEITLPTKSFETINSDTGEVATCILSAINAGSINNTSELEHITDLAVRALDNIIDLQKYPFTMAEKSATQRRNIGIGWTNWAYFFAKNGYKWNSNDARKATHEMTEALQFFCLKASNTLAKEKGACKLFNETKYSKGILPIDTYNKNVDEFASFTLKQNWEELRLSIVKHGLRNSTLTAQMPCESCIKWDHQILTSDGYKNFHQILEEDNFNWQELELGNTSQWIDLNNPITVETLHGQKQTNKVYFNGNKKTITLTLENGKEINCTDTHRFLVKDKDDNNIWKRVYDLEEGDDIVEYQTTNNYMKITKITKSEDLYATYDIEVPEVHHYVLEGLISHNSSVSSNTTNGIEIPRATFQTKSSKSGNITVLLPEFDKYEYEYLWESISNEPYLKVVAIITKFIDQSVSANTSYNPFLWDGKVPANMVVQDILNAYSWGIKTLYYHQTNDMNVDNTVVDCKVCSV